MSLQCVPIKMRLATLEYLEYQFASLRTFKIQCQKSMLIWSCSGNTNFHCRLVSSHLVYTVCVFFIVYSRTWGIWTIWRRMIKVPWTEHKKMKIYCRRLRQKEKLWTPLEVASRQKRWLGHILRHDSLLRITLEGQIQGKKSYGKPRTMLLDRLLKTEEGNIYIRIKMMMMMMNISYDELKMSAQGRSIWSQWRCKPAIWQNTAERDGLLLSHLFLFMACQWHCPFARYFQILYSCRPKSIAVIFSIVISWWP